MPAPATTPLQPASCAAACLLHLQVHATVIMHPIVQLPSILAHTSCMPGLYREISCRLVELVDKLVCLHAWLRRGR